MILSFIFFLLVFVLIGALSTFKSKNTAEDYLLASGSVKPWLVALSAVATNNSGYMFIGMIGYTYMVGLSSAWLLIGWVLGDFLMTFFIHKPLRHMTKLRGALSFSEVIGSWTGEEFKRFRIIAGVITVVFLSVYAAAQLKAGSKSLYILFEWPIHMGAIIGAGIVLIYCLAGGIRASIWTDAAQSFVMIISMVLLAVIGVHHLGGYSETIGQLHGVSDSFLSLNPNKLLFGSSALGFGIFVFSWFFAGIGVVGQPHIMSRFMTLDHDSSVAKARAYYFIWYSLFCVVTIIVGMLARVYIPLTASFDAEMALPTMSLALFPAIGVGFILAGLFAATMSTAGSQLLSCTAAIMQDVKQGKSD